MTARIVIDRRATSMPVRILADSGYGYCGGAFDISSLLSDETLERIIDEAGHRIVENHDAVERRIAEDERMSEQRRCDAQLQYRIERLAEIGRGNLSCVACGCDVFASLQIDHRMPKSRGGSNRLENLQILCVSCNQSKRDMTQEEWIASGKAPAGAKP